MSHFLNWRLPFTASSLLGMWDTKHNTNGSLRFQSRYLTSRAILGREKLSLHCSLNLLSGHQLSRFTLFCLKISSIIKFSAQYNSNKDMILEANLNLIFLPHLWLCLSLRNLLDYSESVSFLVRDWRKLVMMGEGLQQKQYQE